MSVLESRFCSNADSRVSVFQRDFSSETAAHGKFFRVGYTIASPAGRGRRVTGCFEREEALRATIFRKYQSASHCGPSSSFKEKGVQYGRNDRLNLVGARGAPHPSKFGSTRKWKPKRNTYLYEFTWAHVYFEGLVLLSSMNSYGLGGLPTYSPDPLDKPSLYTLKQKHEARTCNRTCDACGKSDIIADPVEPSHPRLWARYVPEKNAVQATIDAIVALLITLAMASI